MNSIIDILNEIFETNISNNINIDIDIDIIRELGMTDNEFNGIEDLINNDLINFQNNVDNIHNNIQFLGNELFENNLFQDVKITLSDSEFNKLKTKIISNYNKKYYNEKMCNICLENFKLQDKIIILKCKHVFHYDCIHDWLNKEKTTCPICRLDQRKQKKK